MFNSRWREKSFTSHRLGRMRQSKWWFATFGCRKCCSIDFKWPKTSTQPGSSPYAFNERLLSTVNMSRRNHRSCRTFTGEEFWWWNEQRLVTTLQVFWRKRNERKIENWERNRAIFIMFSSNQNISLIRLLPIVVHIKQKKCLPSLSFFSFILIRLMLTRWQQFN
jgi:hypothetical protein